MIAWILDADSSFYRWVALIVGITAIAVFLGFIYRGVKRLEDLLGRDEHGKTLPQRVKHLEVEWDAVKAGAVYGWNINGRSRREAGEPQ